jgi:hypothetical protein
MYINVSVLEDIIVEPNVHDALLLGLVMTTKNKLLLIMQATDAAILYIALNDIECLHADDFRQGNIILDISVFSGHDASADDIAYVYGLDKSSPCDSKYLDKAVRDFFIRKKLFVQINPSYGCRLACICGGIELLQEWPSAIVGL